MPKENKSALISKAMLTINNKPVLINLLSRRVRQLNKNARPFVDKRDGEDNIIIALREVVSGKIYPVFKEEPPE